MDGSSETDSPSKVTAQSVGLRGVTTLFPQPQQHLCVAVAYVIEMYSVWSANSAGIKSTNSYLMVSVNNSILACEQIAINAECAVKFVVRVRVKAT
jgi:hypothetical protein